MDTTLAVNPGSSSKKYALYQGGKEILNVLFERTGEGYGKCFEVNGTRKRCEETDENAFEHALDEFLKVAYAEKIIERPEDIVHAGVRIVSPGSYFAQHRVIEEGYIARLEKLISVAPLHIPHQIEELRAVQRLLPHAHVVGASDSAFHSTIPPHIRTYSICKTDTESYDIYRFGYHGLSVASVLKRTERMVGHTPSRVVVCHIGSGVSITAVQDGKSVDSTMGFGPGSGLMMNTRAGELDPSVLFHLMRVKGFDIEKMEQYVSTSGGLKGMLDVSDLRIALDRYARGEHDATVAVMKYVYGIRKTIGAFASVLGGIDALILTATAAERNPTVRSLICEGLTYLGISIDAQVNDSLMEREGVISREGNETSVLVVHTDEMREIAHIAESFK